METKKCAICGKPFQTKNKTQQCCSKACGYYLRERRKKEARTEAANAVCEFCGKEYARRSKIQKYCCAKCKRGAYYEERKAKKPDTKETVCLGCGKSFAPRPGKRFCSVSCRGEYQKQKMAQAEEEREKAYADIRITKEIQVFPELRPRVGQVYHAEAYQENQNAKFYIILIAGKKIVVRLGECVEVKNELEI